MRVVIITDMEGVSGICRWEQVSSGGSMFEEGRRLYTEDVNAAIRGAFNGGATDVVLMDWHGAGGGHSFNSFIPDQLDERCSYVVQERIPQYTKIFEERCDAAFLVGMHARAGTLEGVMNHTVFGSSWQNLWFNGNLVGETGVNAALCGTWEVPVVLITGDKVTCEQGVELLGQGLTTVAVKEGIGRSSAVMISPVRARKMIEKSAAESLKNVGAIKAYDPGKPCEIEVEFMNTSAMENFLPRPGVDQTGERKIKVKGSDWWTAWSAFFHTSVYVPGRPG